MKFLRKFLDELTFTGNKPFESPTLNSTIPFKVDEWKSTLKIIIYHLNISATKEYKSKNPSNRYSSPHKLLIRLLLLTSPRQAFPFFQTIFLAPFAYLVDKIFHQYPSTLLTVPIKKQKITSHSKLHNIFRLKVPMSAANQGNFCLRMMLQ